MNINDERLSKDLNKFIASLPKSKQGSNVYDIICYDKDGNVTDHKYGVNVLTNYGFLQMYTSPNANSTYILFGTGTGTPSKTDQQLFEVIPGMMNTLAMSQTLYLEYSGSSSDNDRYTGNRTNYFDSASNSIISRKKSSALTLDYNYSWLSEDVDITEFGEYTETKYVSNVGYYPADDYHLQTHCMIYDENHQPSHFTKRMNEKVNITVYRANTFCFDILDTFWEQGKYLFINPNYFFRLAQNNGYSSGYYGHAYRSSYVIQSYSIVNGRCMSENDFPMYPMPVNKQNTESASYYNYYNLLYSGNRGFGHDDIRGCWDAQNNTSLNEIYNPINTFADSWIYQTQHTDGYRNNLVVPAYVMTDKRLIFGLGVARSQGETYGKQADIMFFLEKHNLETPEEMSCDFIYTDDWWHPRFSNKFGLRHTQLETDSSSSTSQCLKYSLPVNDFHITSVKRYNYLTDSYSTVEQFVDDPDYDFRNPERAIWGTLWLNDADRVVPGSYDVGININTDIPVLGFNDKSSYDIYLTDKYWDQSTFVKLEHNDTVPAELQHKKYFIKYPTSGGADGGFHTIREPNKHALVPSFEPTLMNTAKVGCVNLDSNYNRWRKYYYASDEGWIFCKDTLIYPDSDDGTGHPYRYTINIYILANEYSWQDKICAFSKNHIVTTPNGYPTIDKTNSSAVIFKVFNIDPTHPEIDPNTTCTDYYGSDIYFDDMDNNRSYYLDDNFIFYVEEKKDILLICHGNKVRMIDMNSPTKNSDFLPESFTWRMAYVFGTDYIVSYIGTSESAYQFIIYDYINKQRVSTFSIPIEGTGWSLYHCFGWDHTIYVNIYKDSKYYLYIYNMNTETLISKMDVALNYLCSSSYRGMNHRCNNYDYDDETLVIHADQNSNYEDGNVGSSTFIIFKDRQDTPLFFDNSGLCLIYGGRHGYPRLKKFNNGADYVLLLTCRMRTDSHGSTDSYRFAACGCATFILDLGYIKNKGYTTPTQLYNNVPRPPQHNATCGHELNGIQANSSWESPYYVDSNNKWYGHVVFYKNEVITFNTFGPPIITPIEMHLPHQIIGTTKTINCYNSPKKFNQYSRGVVINNVES